MYKGAIFAFIGAHACRLTLLALLGKLALLGDRYCKLSLLPYVACWACRIASSRRRRSQAGARLERRMRAALEYCSSGESHQVAPVTCQRTTATPQTPTLLLLCCCFHAGMCAGLVGTATSNGLLELRKKLDPSFTSPVSRCLI